MRETDSRVAGAENEIDAFFDGLLRIRGISRPAMMEALLDRAELIVTGHPAAEVEFAQAIRMLFLNVTGGLNWALRATHRLTSDQDSLVPDDIDAIALECISNGHMYQFVEDAFFSYWKGYATASFPADRTIVFSPTGGDLDARLRRCDSNDELKPFQISPRKDPLRNPRSRVARLFVKSLMKTMSAEAGFVYSIDEIVIHDVAIGFYGYLSEYFRDVSVQLERVSLDGIVRCLSVIMAVSEIHLLISVLMARDPTDLSTSLNWPMLCRPREEWLRWFGVLGAGEDALDTLLFDYQDPAADVAITPLVSMGGHLGVVPSIVLRSNWSRNIIALLARKFSAAYSLYSASKEDKLLADFTGRRLPCGQATKVHLPRWNGRQLPDIDILLSNQRAVVVEVKWLLSASDTRDVIARNDYLKKGRDQLLSIKGFLEEHSDFLKDRGLIGFNTRGNVDYLLVCKGHMGGEDVLADGIVIAEYDAFVGYVQECGVERAMSKLAAYDYLPIIGEDFTLGETRLQFGDWTVAWRQFHTMKLPPDGETDVLEEFYAAAWKHLPAS